MTSIKPALFIRNTAGQISTHTPHLIQSLSSTIGDLISARYLVFGLQGSGFKGSGLFRCQVSGVSIQGSMPFDFGLKVMAHGLWLLVTG